MKGHGSAVQASKQVLRGWLEIPNRKVSSNLQFYKLRGTFDQTPGQLSSCQLVSRHSIDSVLGRKLASITSESCVAVQALRSERPLENQRIEAEGELGKYEFEIQDIVVLNDATNLPFLPGDAADLDPILKAQYRHIELRGKSMSHALHARAGIKRQLSSSLEAQHFIEVETPLLFKSTPEGAREFLVPTRRKGQFFALPQSPQQYKQILMAGGVHRYYQFARCFRDEDSRADRQLEFTQLDLEMAFVDQEMVMNAVEKMVLSVDCPKMFQGSIPRMTYHDAMTHYGSDKPDLRYDLSIKQFETSSDVVETITFALEGHDRISSKDFATLQKALRDTSVYAIKNTKIPEVFSDVASKLQISDNTVTLLARRAKHLSGGSTSMGDARSILQTFLEGRNLTPKRSAQPFQLVWITDFPLFTPVTATAELAGEGQGGNTGLQSTHHPFTAPHPNDQHLLSSDPLKVRAQHYDLVLNGTEIGGGSIRVHKADQQEEIFNVLGMSRDSQKQFEHLLKILRSGCPPHGGFAIGFDRFCMLILEKSSIRDVIAFPKTGKFGSDTLVGSPSEVSAPRLKEYHISVNS